jgi:hypothetical protein
MRNSPLAGSSNNVEKLCVVMTTTESWGVPNASTTTGARRSTNRVVSNTMAGGDRGDERDDLANSGGGTGKDTTISRSIKRSFQTPILDSSKKALYSYMHTVLLQYKLLRCTVVLCQDVGFPTTGSALYSERSPTLSGSHLLSYSTVVLV